MDEPRDDLDPDLLAEAATTPAAAVDVAAVVDEAKRVLSLGTFSPEETAKALGLDGITLRFCLGLMQGKSATQALRDAGHHAVKRNSLASAASKKAKSRKVVKFLQLAAEHKSAPAAVAVPDDDEKLRILAQAIHATTNVNFKISGIRAIEEIEAKRAARDGTDSIERDPIAILNDLAGTSAFSALIANELARAHGLDFRSADAPALPEGMAEWLTAQATLPRFKHRSPNGGANGGQAWE